VDKGRITHTSESKWFREEKDRTEMFAMAKRLQAVSNKSCKEIKTMPYTTWQNVSAIERNHWLISGVQTLLLRSQLNLLMYGGLIFYLHSHLAYQCHQEPDIQTAFPMTGPQVGYPITPHSA